MSQNKPTYIGDPDDVVTIARNESDHNPLALGEALEYIQTHYQDHSVQADELPLEDKSADMLLWGVVLGMNLETPDEIMDDGGLSSIPENQH